MNRGEALTILVSALALVILAFITGKYELVFSTGTLGLMIGQAAYKLLLG